MLARASIRQKMPDSGPIWRSVGVQVLEDADSFRSAAFDSVEKERRQEVPSATMVAPLTEAIVSMLTPQ